MIVERYWKLDGKRLLNPRTIMEAAVDTGDSPAWYGIANGVKCPRGRHWGEANVIVGYDDLAEIDTDTPLDIECVHENGTATFKGYYVIKTQKAEKITNDIAAQWVVLADRRYILERVGCCARYNLRHDAVDYIESTTILGVPYTWQEVLADLWSLLPAIAGTCPTLPFTPVSTPENLYFEVMSAWRAINQVLTAIGCVVVLDPFTGEFSFVSAIADQSGIDDLTADAALLHEFGPSQLPSNGYVESVLVSFPGLPIASAAASPFPTAPESQLEALGMNGIAGTDWPILDTLFAFTGNESDRNIRAIEIRDALIGILRPMAEPWGRIYSGIIQLVPGAQITDTEWVSDGDSGLMTVARFSCPTPEIDWPAIPYGFARSDSKSYILKTTGVMSGFDYYTNQLGSGTCEEYAVGPTGLLTATGNSVTVYNKGGKVEAAVWIEAAFTDNGVLIGQPFAEITYQYEMIANWFGGITVASIKTMDGVDLSLLAVVRDPLSVFTYQRYGSRGYCVFKPSTGKYYAIQAPCASSYTPPPETNPVGACCVYLGASAWACYEEMTENNCLDFGGFWAENVTCFDANCEQYAP